jgi:hypothetical protein
MSLATLLFALPQNEHRNEPSIHFGARSRFLNMGQAYARWTCRISPAAASTSRAMHASRRWETAGHTACQEAERQASDVHYAVPVTDRAVRPAPRRGPGGAADTVVAWAGW